MRKFSWALITLLTIGFASGFASAALAAPHGTQVAGNDQGQDNNDQGDQGNQGNQGDDNNQGDNNNE